LSQLGHRVECEAQGTFKLVYAEYGKLKTTPNPIFYMLSLLSKAWVLQIHRHSLLVVLLLHKRFVVHSTQT
jgi:hypothetical protein